MLLTPDLLQKVAAAAGCKTTTSATMVHCLRQKTEDELLEVTLKMVGVPILVSPHCDLGQRLDSCIYLLK